MHNQI